MKFHFSASEHDEAKYRLIELTKLYGQTPLEKATHVVALGGDGHMLHVLHDTLQFGLPVFGMNCGHLGFLMNDFSEIDILVNSAGIARHTPTVETTEVDYDDVMAVNVKSAYFLAQFSAKKMIEKGVGGSIIQISSQMAHVGGIDRAVYCGTKHAIEGINKSMAMEFGPHKIRVNSICPTFIRTPFTEATFKDPEKVKWIESKIKMGRVGEVEDIMGAVKFLASDASAMVTGSSILIDGGWTAG